LCHNVFDGENVFEREGQRAMDHDLDEAEAGEREADEYDAGELLGQDGLFEAGRVGKDEMNLVEHPFASLSKEKDTRVIQLEWTTRHLVTGQERRASWRVAGDPPAGAAHGQRREGVPDGDAADARRRLVADGVLHAP
jgi:hypothetical protein